MCARRRNWIGLPFFCGEFRLSGRVCRARDMHWHSSSFWILKFNLLFYQPANDELMYGQWTLLSQQWAHMLSACWTNFEMFWNVLVFGRAGEKAEWVDLLLGPVFALNAFYGHLADRIGNEPTHAFAHCSQMIFCVPFSERKTIYLLLFCPAAFVCGPQPKSLTVNDSAEWQHIHTQTHTDTHKRSHKWAD